MSRLHLLILASSIACSNQEPVEDLATGEFELELDSAGGDCSRSDRDLVYESFATVSKGGGDYTLAFEYLTDSEQTLACKQNDSRLTCSGELSFTTVFGFGSTTGSAPDAVYTWATTLKKGQVRNAAVFDFTLVTQSTCEGDDCEDSYESFGRMTPCEITQDYRATLL